MQAEAVKATQRRIVWNVLRRNLSLTAGCLILLCVVFTALFPGLIASQSPTDQNLTAMLAAPSAEHIWGTDELGRDIFARVIWGTRYDLVIGLAAASIPFVVGTLIGLFTAYFGGILDTLFMRLVDVMMSFPVIVLIIAIVAVLGPGIGNMYLAMWLVGWTSYARLVRSAVMVEKKRRVCAGRAYAGLFPPAHPVPAYSSQRHLRRHRIRGFRRIDVHAHGCGAQLFGRWRTAPHPGVGRHYFGRPFLFVQRAVDQHFSRHLPGRHGRGAQPFGRRSCKVFPSKGALTWINLYCSKSRT